MSSFASSPEPGERDETQSGKTLPVATLLVYALPSMPLGFMGALISIYLLKFSTDVLLIAPGVIGLLFGISKIWDAISDPMAGYLSDRTNSRFGRRRPWLLAAGLPLGLLFIALWSPPSSLGANALVVWTGVGILLFYTANTALGIPHLALGAELTQDYHDRSRVFGGRMLLEFAGIFLAAGALALIETSNDPRSALRAVAIGGALLAVAFTGITAVYVRERKDYQGRGASRPYAAIRDVLRNRHARPLIVLSFLDQLGFSCLITVVPFMIQYILGEPGMTGVLVGGAIGAGLLFYPIWIPLSRSFGKRNPWIVAMLIKALAFGSLFFVEPGAFVPVLIAVVLIGGVQGAGAILGPSIQADVVDYDELQSGERKEGAYFAVWNLAAKTAAGVAVMGVGFALQVAEFEPNASQSEATLSAIRWLAAGVPLLLGLVSAALLMRFRLDAREHAEIRTELDSRALALRVADSQL